MGPIFGDSGGEINMNDELRSSFEKAFAGRRVMVTGHTGFKGSWLSLWLLELGAHVSGYALAAEETSLFRDLGLESLISSRYGDVRDAAALESAVRAARPEVIFHLAAQPIVRVSYNDPKTTFDTNVSGLVNLLEAVRKQSGVRVCQIITTDKVYENHETGSAYSETDRLGGRDPYSASKACAELVSASYRDSFFPPGRLSTHGVSLSTARAGNVIGGGDWARDRLIPDCVRALAEGRTIAVRNGTAIRPWQHVLEPLSGYLQLAARQLASPEQFAQAWNFGPAPEQHVPVAAVVESVIRHWGTGACAASSDASAPHEAGVLRLNCSKALAGLNWKPVYDHEVTIRETVAWYKASVRPEFDAIKFTQSQILNYAQVMRARFSDV